MEGKLATGQRGIWHFHTQNTFPSPKLSFHVGNWWNMQTKVSSGDHQLIRTWLHVHLFSTVGWSGSGRPPWRTASRPRWCASAARRRGTGPGTASQGGNSMALKSFGWFSEPFLMLTAVYTGWQKYSGTQILLTWRWDLGRRARQVETWYNRHNSHFDVNIICVPEYTCHPLCIRSWLLRAFIYFLHKWSFKIQ